MPPGTIFAVPGVGAVGSTGNFDTANEGTLYVVLNGAFWSVRYPNASCRSSYMPKPARITVFGSNGFHATPIRGCGRNLALFCVKMELATRGWLEITPLGNV